MISAMRLQNFDEDPAKAARRASAGKSYDEDETREMVRAAYERGMREGRSQGHAEGRAEAEGEMDAALAESLQATAAQLDELARGAGDHRAALEAQVLEFTLSVCDAVFPELVAKMSAERVGAQVRRALKMAIGSQAIRIRLSPQTKDVLARELGHRMEYYRIEQACRIDADPDLAPGDVRMEWDSGSLEYAYETVTGLILEELRKTHAASQAAQKERGNNGR